MDFNRVIIVGRVTADTQTRTTPGGQSVAAISVATGRTWTDKNGQRQEETEFHNVVLWGRQAEVAGQYLKKGTMVLIEGRLKTRSWTDKNGGPRKTTEIIAEQMRLGPKPMGQGGGSGSGGAGASGGSWNKNAGGSSDAGFHAASGNINADLNAAEPAGDKSGGAAPAEEEIPVINLDEDDIKPEDIPF